MADIYDESGKPPLPFVSALRRWPLILLGTVAGLIGGFFIFLSQPPQYQSSAKVLVIKQRADFTPGDSRSAYVDDYVATQIPLIKSDRILTAAAKRPELGGLSEPLPENANLGASVLLAGLTIARDKEATSGSQAGSNVLLMTFKAKNPRDTFLLLTAVIEAYKRELSDVYAGQTRKQIKSLEAQIEGHKKLIEDHRANNARLTRELLEITGENLEVIRTRVSAGRQKELSLTLEKKELDEQIKMIAAAGPDRRKRLAISNLLGASKKAGPEAAAGAPENQLSALQAQRREMAERLGKDHQQMKAIDSQIEFLKRQFEDQNPENATAKFDELSQLALQLEQRFKTVLAQLDEVAKQCKADEDKIKKGSDIARQIDEAVADRSEERKRLSAAEADLTILKPKELVESASGYEASVITPPREGGKIGTGMVAWTVAGAVLGIFLGIGLALLAELTDKSFRSAAEIRQRLGVPVIGHLPPINTKLVRAADVSPNFDSTLVVALRPKSIDSEAYRGVRAQLFVQTQDKGHQIIQITSPNPGDGKSTLAANLAISIAQAGKKVILVDCDFRKPRVHKLFNILKPELGLATVTDGQAELGTAIRHSEIDLLDLLPCGPRPSNPAELLSSAKFQQVLSDLRKIYDFVIIDTPPMLAVSDPRVVAQRVDGVLMVFKITKKARMQSERAREQLADMGANLLAVVVNGVGSLNDQYGYNYAYKYQYSYDYEYAQTYSDDVPSGEFEAQGK